MTETDKKKVLAAYRLQQARESLEEAQFLLSGGKSLRSVMNRIYYGMFYAVLALLIYEPYTSSKHSGVIAYFNKKFIKEGIFPEALGQTLKKAFDLRQRGDYREYFELTMMDVEPLLKESFFFLSTIESYLGNTAE